MTLRYELGLVVRLEEGPEKILRKVRDLGLTACHISVYDPSYFSQETARTLRDESEATGVKIAGLWAGWPGRVVWDFVYGPETVGLVPLAVRNERAEIIMQASDFAASLGIETVMTHLGFVPENAKDELYTSLIPVIRKVADHCGRNGQTFCFETGQETPITLLRTIHDVEADNVGVNFDPANLLLYGKGNPQDAMDILGPYVRGVHIKDGEYPVDGRNLGQEKPVGEGRVDFPLLIEKLDRFGYDGPLCIECELEGQRQIEEIRSAKARLEEWLK